MWPAKNFRIAPDAGFANHSINCRGRATRRGIALMKGDFDSTLRSIDRGEIRTESIHLPSPADPKSGICQPDTARSQSTIQTKAKPGVALERRPHLLWQKFARPRSGADHQLFRFINAARRGNHADRAAGRYNFPFLDRLLEVQGCIGFLSLPDRRAHRIFRTDKPGHVLIHAHRLGSRIKRRKSFLGSAGASSMSSCGRLNCFTLLIVPATTSVCGNPIINPPVIVSNSWPLACSSSRHNS